MQRYNMFLLVHKGLRAMMCHVLTGLQQNDPTSTAYEKYVDELSLVLTTIDSHGKHEDNFIFTLLENCNSSLQEEMEAEHVDDHTISNNLRTLIVEFKNAGDETAKRKAAGSINYACYEYIAFNLKHLNKEEIKVNEVLWANYTDGELLQANQKLVASLSPEEAKASATWMIRGCNNTEIINWLNGIKNNIPQPLMQLLLSLAEAELPAERFKEVQDKVLETA